MRGSTLRKAWMADVAASGKQHQNLAGEMGIKEYQFSRIPDNGRGMTLEEIEMFIRATGGKNFIAACREVAKPTEERIEEMGNKIYQQGIEFQETFAEFRNLIKEGRK